MEHSTATAADSPRSPIYLVKKKEKEKKHPVLIVQISSNGKFTAAPGPGSQEQIGGTC